MENVTLELDVKGLNQTILIELFFICDMYHVTSLPQRSRSRCTTGPCPWPYPFRFNASTIFVDQDLHYYNNNIELNLSIKPHIFI